MACYILRMRRAAAHNRVPRMTIIAAASVLSAFYLLLLNGTLRTFALDIIGGSSSEQPWEDDSWRAMLRVLTCAPP